MLKEYAIDPGSVCDKAAIKALYDLFDYSNPRRISDFPGNWAERLMDIAKNKKATDPKFQLLYKEIETRILALKNRRALIRNYIRNYDSSADWVTNAATSNKTEPFQAIIFNGASASSILPQDIDSLHPKFVCSNDEIFFRNTPAIVNFLKAALQNASEFVFIDPYISFDAAMRSNGTLAQRQATAARYTNTFLSIFSEIKKNPKFLISRAYFSISDFGLSYSASQIETKISSILGFPGSRITVKIRPNVDTHNRYILTDVASFQFGDSLWFDPGYVGKSDRVSMMSFSSASKIKYEFI